MISENRQSQSSGSIALLTVLIAIVVLYFGRSVLIPVALAVLFAFLLGPLVVRLRNWGLGPALSAVTVVGFSLVVAAAIGTIMLVQLSDLANRLPGYQQNMQKKILSLRESGSGVVHKVSRIVYQLNEQLKPPSPESVGAEQAEKPVPVEIRHQAFSPVETVQKVIGSVLEIVVTAAIVVVFVLFMLIQRQDLRDRVVRLAGAGRINVTTTVLDDAARRVSRYLLAQLGLNSSYGVMAAIGLYFIGVPNPILWGIFTMLLRYVPYLGIWIAALLPATLAFAIDPGWSQLLMIVGLYFGIDMVMYNFLEPMLYGSSTGLSPIAVLVTTVFWTWLWGPVGLLLATPLTVCVVVLGRHVPRLEFLSVMLSDETPLPQNIRFYQRMLAMDFEEASEIAEKSMQGESLEKIYDSILIPALTLAENERHQGKLDEKRLEFVLSHTRMLVDDLAERERELVGAGKQHKGTAPVAAADDSQRLSGCRVLCIAARDEADEIAANMLVRLLQRAGLEAQTLSSDTLAGETVQKVQQNDAGVVCVCSVPPFGYRQTRYLCRRMKSEHPELRVVAAVLTEEDVAQLRQRHPPLPAHEIAASLREALSAVTSLAVTSQEPASEETATRRAEPDTEEKKAAA